MLNWIYLNLGMENAYKISIPLKMNTMWDMALKRCLHHLECGKGRSTVSKLWLPSSIKAHVKATEASVDFAKVTRMQIICLLRIHNDPVV